MMRKKIDLDEATIRVMRKVLATPPKPHDEMKVGRVDKKKASSKNLGVSAKPHTASKTDRD